MDVIYLYPNSEISGDLSGSWYSVDDPYDAPDEDATYVENHVCPESVYFDLYGVQDQADIGTISKVTVYYRWKTSVSGGMACCWCKIKTHGTYYYVKETPSPSNVYITESKEWTLNPYTGLTWTWDEISALEIYISSKYDMCYPISKGRCTQTYIKVEGDWYDPPTVTSSAADDIDYKSATLNGEITVTGGLNSTKRGFEWKEGLEGEVTKTEEEGNFGTGVFDYALSGLEPNVQYYFRAYATNNAGTGYGEWLDFTTDKTTPTVTTQDATDNLQNQVTGNGNITCSGGENCTERGFEYGLTKTNTWETHDTGSYPVGAYTKDITSLLANTEYWHRAFAKNTIGYGYGEWVKFQTAAAGTTPTGTKVSICSDYSGYSCILNKSLTDDGETYESYFVISTDLAEKQGLHIKKRLEDLYSYFEKKASGTCKIYVKRDNETTWQYAGQISMVGDEDIIVKHLPSENQDTSGDVDFLAKHFLVKFLFISDFDFIGLITEFVPIGVR